MRTITRRGVLAGTLGLTVGARGWQCARAAQATPVSATFPVTIPHALGETTIPAAPQRILATDAHEGLDSLLALGVTPVSAIMERGYIDGLSPWATAAGAEEVAFLPEMQSEEPDFEAIAAAKPDLILAAWIEAPVYETLSAIAPTLVIKNADATTWQDIQRMVGEATGHAAEAEAVIAETEQVIAAQQERLAPYQETSVAIAYFWFDQFLVNGKDAPIGRILAPAGIPIISPGVAMTGEIDMLSLEEIHRVQDAEVIIAPDFIADQTAAQEANALFRALPAVQQGGYVVLPPEVAQALYLESALSMQWGVPRLVDAVIAGVEGKGKRLDT